MVSRDVHVGEGQQEQIGRVGARRLSKGLSVEVVRQAPKASEVFRS